VLASANVAFDSESSGIVNSELVRQYKLKSSSTCGVP
jgi:hypothetical protein